MNKTHSQIGLITSIIIHGLAFAGVGWLLHNTPPVRATEEVSSISMQMMTALLEQPQVATAQTDNTDIHEEVLEEVQPKEEIPEKVIEQEPIVAKQKKESKPKPKEKPKEKPKPKKKSKPKAIEKSSVTKKGIVAKAVPNIPQNSQAQMGSTSNNNQISSNNGSQGNSQASNGDLNRYKAQLQKALQHQANNSYPRREQMMRKTGTVTLSFSISSSGKLINVKVVKSSGNSNLDVAAVKAAQNTDMKSAPPTGFPSSLTVPIRFSLH
ncbi:energy transducer TonB [Otariodibacter sp.]|uniref:energy transducer TonB n=1 Tax=Otariodibacter sp. TaxID=3030919 RepID=UPI00260C996D|nr:energy transducer TonB [Otariodibacter sp.]